MSPRAAAIVKFQALCLPFMFNEWVEFPNMGHTSGNGSLSSPQVPPLLRKERITKAAFKIGVLTLLGNLTSVSPRAL